MAACGTAGRTRDRRHVQRQPPVHAQRARELSRGSKGQRPRHCGARRHGRARAMRPTSAHRDTGAGLPSSARRPLHPRRGEPRSRSCQGAIEAGMPPRNACIHVEPGPRIAHWAREIARLIGSKAGDWVLVKGSRVHAHGTRRRIAGLARRRSPRCCTTCSIPSRRSVRRLQRRAVHHLPNRRGDAHGPLHFLHGRPLADSQARSAARRPADSRYRPGPPGQGRHTHDGRAADPHVAGRLGAAVGRSHQPLRLDRARADGGLRGARLHRRLQQGQATAGQRRHLRARRSSSGRSCWHSAWRWRSTRARPSTRSSPCPSSRTSRPTSAGSTSRSRPSSS